MKKITCWFSGRVQGVGFRYTTVSIARDFQVSGYVKNLPDGRVEVVAEGEDKQTDAFIAAIQQTMAANISQTQTLTEPADGRFKRFTVAF